HEGAWNDARRVVWSNVRPRDDCYPGATWFDCGTWRSVGSIPPWAAMGLGSGTLAYRSGSRMGGLAEGTNSADPASSQARRQHMGCLYIGVGILGRGLPGVYSGPDRSPRRFGGHRFAVVWGRFAP